MTSLFLARRLYGFALIADGFGMVIGLRFGLALRAAKRIGRINGKRFVVQTPFEIDDGFDI